jgi:hypothetical protein
MGPWLVRPKKPAGRETWIGIRQAAHILDLSQRTTQKYLGVFLVYCRPTPCKYAVTLSSVTAFLDATRDPEFWESEELQRRLKKTVQEAQRKHCSRIMDNRF